MVGINSFVNWKTKAFYFLVSTFNNPHTKPQVPLDPTISFSKFQYNCQTKYKYNAWPYLKFFTKIHSSCSAGGNVKPSAKINYTPHKRSKIAVSEWPSFETFFRSLNWGSYLAQWYNLGTKMGIKMYDKLFQPFTYSPLPFHPL